MACNHDATRLGAYLDGELEPGESRAVEQQIAGCPECAAEVAELVRLKRSLRLAQNQFVPSVEFRKKIRGQIAPRRRRMPRLIPAAAAFVLLAAVFLGWRQLGRRGSADAFAEVADLHVNALASTNPYDVVSSDRHTVKPWFQGKIPFSFNVPEFAGTEFTLLGGRLVYFHQHPAAQLVVGLRQHKISVLILQEPADGAREFAGPDGVAQRDSFSMETWRSHDLRFVAISDADPAAVGKLGDAFKLANE